MFVRLITVMVFIFFMFHAQAAPLQSCKQLKVKDSSVLMNSQRWLGLTKSVQKNKVYKLFDMKNINVSQNNRVELSKSISLLGRDMRFKGKIAVNPRAKDGELLAKYSARMSDGSFNLVALHAQYVDTNICIFKEGNKARVSSSFTAAIKHKKRLHHLEMSLVDTKAGEALSFHSGVFSLANIIPQVKNAPYLKEYSLGMVEVSSKQIEFKGKLDGKLLDIKAVRNSKGDFVIQSDVLSMTDVIPQTEFIPYLKRFSLDKLSQNSKEIVLDGRVSKQSLAIHASIKDRGSFNIAVQKLTLNELFPVAQTQRYLKSFKPKKLSFYQKMLTLDGSINGKDLRIVANLNEEKSFTIESDILPLTSIIPQCSDIAFFKNFKLKKLSFNPEKLSVLGKINNKAIDINIDLEKKENFKISAKHLDYGEILPLLRTQPYLKGFRLQDLSFDHGKFALEGSMKGNDMAIVLDQKRPQNFSITTDDLVIGDIVPATKSLTFLQ